MQKIKASEVLKLKPEMTLEELKKFKLFGIDPLNQKVRLFKSFPLGKPNKIGGYLADDYWESPTAIKLIRLYDKQLYDSLREIDFSEESSKINGGFHSDSPSQDLIVNQDKTLVPVRTIVANNSGEKIEAGMPVFIDENRQLTVVKLEPTRIFKEGDIVHIIYGHLFGFGKSRSAKVIENKSNFFVRIKFDDDGDDSTFEEKFLSFAPFSYEHGGFTQVRPKPEPKVGDWGFFYDEENPEFFSYGKLSKINDIKESCYVYELKGILGLYYRYKYFSHEMPELAKDVPTPKFN